MAYCTQCGAEAPNGAKFCSKCGHHIEQINPVVATPLVAHPTSELYLKEPGGEVHPAPKPAPIHGRTTSPARKLDWPAWWLLALWIAIVCILGIVRVGPINAIWIAGVLGASIASILIGVLLAAIVRLFNSDSRLVRDALCASAVIFLLQLWGMHIEPSKSAGPIPHAAQSSLQDDTTISQPVTEMPQDTKAKLSNADAVAIQYAQNRRRLEDDCLKNGESKQICIVKTTPQHCNEEALSFASGAEKQGAWAQCIVECVARIQDGNMPEDCRLP
jgi:hypothetical protein